MLNNSLNLISENTLQVPDYLVEPESWAGHIPFAFWLVDHKNPQVFVELGTHTGNSYFAFCQAVKAAEINTRCYAVDTWEGDSHAGYYAEDIYAGVWAYNEEKYAGFSNLIRKTFDNAVSEFADASIDILHIDGLHTYAAVKHDFDTWFPKLSANAVVLFHDTSVRTEDFGVWRLWQEISAEYRNISFTHSNGLGIIFLGTQPESIETLISVRGEKNKLHRILLYFQRLGEVCQLNIRLKQTQKSNAEYNSLVKDLQHKISHISNEREGEIAALYQSIEDKNTIITLLEHRAVESEHRAAALADQVAFLESQYARVMASTSWRLTKPLRYVAIQTRRLKHRCLPLLKWVYHKLPLSPRVRSRIRGWYYRRHSEDSSRHISVPAVSADASYAARARRHAPLNILLLERSVPRPNQDAGSVMIFNFIELLRKRGYAITLIPFDLQYDPEYTPVLQGLGVKCLHTPDIASIQAHLAQAGTEYDIILSCRPDQTEAVLPLFQTYAPDAMVVYETHDLHFLREERQAEVENDPKLREQAKWRKQQELKIAAAADCTLVVSENERNILHGLNPDLYIEVIPVIEKFYNTSADYPRRRDLVFIGGYDHRPNADAVVFFAREILPLILQEIPEIVFHVVGSNPPVEITALTSEHIQVHGFVPDIDELMQSVRISVNPLRYGAGVKGKVVTSMSYAVPCVGTSVAMEGMGLTPGTHALVADAPEEFASAVVNLYRDEKRWKQIATNGLEFIRAHFSQEAAAGTFEHIFDKLTPPSRRHRLILQRHETRDAYLTTRNDDEIQRRTQLEEVQEDGRKAIHTCGYCFICNAQKDFYTAWDYALTAADGQLQPNWREWMNCPGCGFNNRTRASMHLFHLLCAPEKNSRIYLTEQSTPLYAWCREQYPDLVGSEFLDTQLKSGQIDSAGIRHENLTSLSFQDEAFEYIISFDVFEHIPDYIQAFKECFRTLAPGGVLFFTVPFDVQSNEHIVRAQVDKNGEIRHNLPPEYHGDPLSSEGCLCYYHFGWEMLEQLRDMGFADVAAYTYWSGYYAYFGVEQILFYARK